MSCDTESGLKNSKFRCDDCGSVFAHKDAHHVGKSLTICKKCLNKNKSLDFMKIFGKRGSTKTKRKNNTTIALGEAGVEVPDEMELENLDRLAFDANVVAPNIGNVPETVDERIARIRQENREANLRGQVQREINEIGEPDEPNRELPDEEFDPDLD